MSIRVEVYRFLAKKLRYFRDEKYRNFRNEVRDDIKLTRIATRQWGQLGSDSLATKGFFVVLSFTKVPMYAKLHTVIAKMAQLAGYKTLIVTYRGNAVAFEYYRLLGINDFLFWDDFEAKHVDLGRVDQLVSELFPPFIDIDTLISLRYEHVDIGKHALSMVCRKRLEGQLDINDQETQDALRFYFRRALISVLAAKEMLTQYPVKKMLVRDSGYVPNGGIFESALHQGVDCIVHDFGQQKGAWVFKRHDTKNKNEHYFSISANTWDHVKNLPWTDEHERLLKEEFEGRYKADSLSDTRRLQFGKVKKDPDEVRKQLGLDPSKKTAIIFSHIAWDAAFFYGTCIFGDYERWLFETVKYVATNCSDINWVVKLHPFNAFKLQREEKKEESEIRLLKQLDPLPEHVIIMRADTDINTHSLFPVVDYVLTVNGTVGMEFPCFGIPSVLAGTGRYNGRGFTIDTNTQQEYFTLLDKLHTIPRLTPEQVLLARKHYYYLMKHKQTNMEDILPMELKKFHEAQSELFNNVAIAPKSLDEFKSSVSYKKLSEWMMNSDDYDLL
ncbi:MAG: hypothetical protein JNJ65_06105 [Cyclobacteriaceae bacterium]|nr:hypothetical protein [Cyclobacteriaceae bacterium]